ncbi:VOC family protein [Nocardia aurea]|uniref:VOC family protein n=1 Tax=Nocardia aurea TaxID=2144174 RepID=UPI000D68C7C0|nr:VOC family protein [Nocardia aurea]
MAINRIDHAAVRVADLGQALEWYEDVLGLTVLDRNSERALLACSGEEADLTLINGGQSVVSFAFGVDHGDDIDEIVSRLKANSVEFERYKEPDRPGHGEILGFDLPSGHRMEFVVGYGDRTAGQTNTKSDGGFRPTDIDHINLLGEADPREVSDFMKMVLGFKQSLVLTMAGKWAASWLRATKLDHDIAYMQAQRPSDRLHHIAFAVEDGNHYFRLSDRLVETGNRWEFGPGRHMGGIPRDTYGFGTNCFAYAFDPTGNRNEFSAGMNEFEDHEYYMAETSPEKFPEIMNGWAYNMPETFMTIGS